MLAQQSRLGVHERHRVLQLIAEPERSSRLIIAAAAPDTTRQDLIEKPAVGQHIERRIGRLDLYGAEGAQPVLLYLLQRFAGRCRTAEALRQSKSSEDYWARSRGHSGSTRN